MARVSVSVLMWREAAASLFEDEQADEAQPQTKTMANTIIVAGTRRLPGQFRGVELSFGDDSTRKEVDFVSSFSVIEIPGMVWARCWENAGCLFLSIGEVVDVPGGESLSEGCWACGA